MISHMSVAWLGSPEVSYLDTRMGVLTGDMQGSPPPPPPPNLITNKMNVSVFGQILLDNPIHMTELSVNNSGESSFYNFSSVQ